MRALAYICKDLPTKFKVAKGAQCCKVLRERAGDLEASARGADRELRQVTVNVSTKPAEGRASECLEPFTWAAKNLWSLGLRNLGPGLGAENGLAEVN